MPNEFDGGGNYYNKYESNNPAVQVLMREYFKDLDEIIISIKDEISLALEVGCGEGYVTQHIQNLGIPIKGTDISSRVISIAQQNNPSIHFSECSVYDLQSLGEIYDLVLANEVLEHLVDYNTAIEEMKKAAGKYLFFSIPNEPYFRLANILRLKYLKDLGNTPGHINHWSVHGFKGVLIGANLDIIKIKTSTLWIMALCRI
ncbi:class I SAM-dependent methyltransferase [Methanoculleus bourgensis]|uniref:class I SAM-dependent methyltransferase n=1 Tax=Methanoculleus bourgensis TaxID=83986 RepID=UPI0022EFBB07|nr:class I SAM-dependent methyltransferase [Methanoculleus bourgensis]GLI45420.1 hypothetical protein MBOURGENBZM_02120 [Methanoculleus bourgensis]